MDAFSPAPRPTFRHHAHTHSASPGGAMIRRWRNYRSMSQMELGIEADLSARHISFLETDRSHPKRESLLAIVDALNENIAYGDLP